MNINYAENSTSSVESNSLTLPYSDHHEPLACVTKIRQKAFKTVQKTAAL